MKRVVYLFLVLTVVFTKANAQNISQQWSVKAGGKGYDIIHDIAGDEQGNTYAVGSFQQSAQFGKEELMSLGDSDIFLAKYNERGEIVWVVSAGSDMHSSNSITESAKALTVTRDGVYVVGEFSKQAAFGKHHQLLSNGKDDIFIAKYTPEGELIWLKSAGGSSQDIVNDIVHDEEGNVYITGHYQNSARFDDVVFTKSEYTNAFIAKYSMNGNVVWVKDFDNYGNSNGVSLVIHNDQLYVAGNFVNGIGIGNSKLKSAGGEDVFLVKMSTEGEVFYSTKIGGIKNDRVMNINVRDNGIYIAGQFEDRLSFGQKMYMSKGKSDAFVAKYDLKGFEQWFATIGGNGFDKGTSIDVVDDETIYFAGTYSESIALREVNMISKGSTDIFVAKIDNEGTILDVHSLGDDGQDFSNAVAVSNGELIMSGSFNNDLNLDNGSISSSGATDVYINKVEIGFIEMKNTGLAHDYTVFPNPNHGVFSVKGKILTEQGATVFVQIFNSVGKLIHSKSYKGIVELNDEIDLAKIDKGMYILKVVDEQSVLFTDKIIIH